MLSSALVSVCWQDNARTYQPSFSKFNGNMAHGSSKKQLDFGGYLGHVMLWSGYGWGYACFST